MRAELDRVSLELARRQLHERIRYFQPHGGQHEFIGEITRPGAFIVVSGAGNGWGGSELMTALLAAVMWPLLAPPCFADPVFTDWKHPKRARIYSTPAELSEVGALQTAITKLFPKGRFTATKGKFDYPQIFKTDTGWVLDMFSYERDDGEAAGPNIGLQIFNEPPPELLWKEALARSRAGGIITGKMTSLLEHPWVVAGIFDKANGQDVRVRYGSSCENCKQHGVNGTLEHTRIEQILNQYDADEREARFTGRPLSMSGRIMKGFDPKVHVRKFNVPTDASVSHGMIVDPAIGKPLAIVWRFVDSAGILHYYDEYPGFQFDGAKDDNLTVGDYIDLIRLKEEGRRIDTRILDRHFGNQRRTLGGKTLKEEFGDAEELAKTNRKPIDFIDSYTMDPAVEVETGIRKVKDYLKYDKNKAIDSLNTPRIVIHPRCANLIAAFQGWARNPKTLRPMEQFKDFMDLVRYDVMSEPKVEEPSSWPSNALRPFYGVSA